MQLTISDLKAEDRPRWAELWRGYLAFYETVLPDEQYHDTWARLLHGTSIHGLAARRNGAMVGITHYLFHAHCWISSPACYLQDLFVDPAARGTGAGRALIEGVADRARAQACGRMYWRTQAGNSTARRLYDAVARDTGFIVYDYKLE